MQQILDTRLATLAERGWTLAWRAVRRRLNEEADLAATEGVLWAAALQAEGATDPATRVVWERTTARQRSSTT